MHNRDLEDRVVSRYLWKVGYDGSEEALKAGRAWRTWAGEGKRSWWCGGEDGVSVAGDWVGGEGVDGRKGVWNVEGNVGGCGGGR